MVRRLVLGVLLVGCSGSAGSEVLGPEIKAAAEVDGGTDAPSVGPGSDGGVDPPEDSGPGDLDAAPDECDAKAYCAGQGFVCGNVSLCGKQVSCGYCASDQICDDNAKFHACGNVCVDRPDMRAACAGTYDKWTVTTTCADKPWRSTDHTFRQDDTSSGCVTRSYQGKQWYCCGI